MDLITQGLTLSLTGIVVTFASLGLFILIIILLQKFFPSEEAEATASTEGMSATLPSMAATDLDQETAAAIAIAIAHFQSLETEASGIGSALVEGPGPWWHARQYPAEPIRPRQTNRSNQS
jgi:sodium pump decarboxylase gamma subunit